MQEPRTTCATCGQEYIKHTSSAYHCASCYGLMRRQRESAVAPYLKRLLHYAKGRAASKTLPIDIDIEHLLELWDSQKGKCAVTGLVMTHHRMGDKDCERNFNVSLDKKEPYKGYVKGNVQLVCFRVNLIKSDMDSSEFFWWVQTLADKMSTR